MPVGVDRLKALYGILQKRPGWHPHTVIRWGVGIVFTVLVALLPLTDTLRFDLWRGQHKWLGQTVGLQEAARAFLFPFLAVNVAIVVVSRFYGRYLCGFVCPVGSLARLIEWARFKDRRGGHRYLGPLVALVSCGLLCFVAFAFWVDPRMLVDGSPLALGIGWTLLGGSTAVCFAVVQGMGLRFCRDWCPSGVYFAVLGQKTANGVELAHPEACTDCGLCDTVCPMDLKPRHMSGGPYRGGSGLYGELMSNFALCIRCGDCVTACEEVGSRRSEDVALRMGMLPEASRDHRPAPEVPPEDAPEVTDRPRAAKEA